MRGRRGMASAPLRVYLRAGCRERPVGNGRESGEVANSPPARHLSAWGAWTYGRAASSPPGPQSGEHAPELSAPLGTRHPRRDGPLLCLPWCGSGGGWGCASPFLRGRCKVLGFRTVSVAVPVPNRLAPRACDARPWKTTNLRISQRKAFILGAHGQPGEWGVFPRPGGKGPAAALA